MASADTIYVGRISKVGAESGQSFSPSHLGGGNSIVAFDAPRRRVPSRGLSATEPFVVDFQPKDQSVSFEGPEAIRTDELETFPYAYPYRDAVMTITTDEFTAVCPFSGLPDFGRVTFEYIPSDRCVELRSLKYYLHSYRNVGIWYEHAVHRILEDFVRCVKPKKLTVLLDYNVRGGLKSLARAEYDAAKDSIPEKSPQYRDGAKMVS